MYKPNDVTSQLVEHIKKNLNKGYSQDTLRYSLLSQGYSRITVDGALKRANEELSEKVPEVKEKPKIIYRLYDSENKPVKTFEMYKDDKSLWAKFLDWFK